MLKRRKVGRSQYYYAPTTILFHQILYKIIIIYLYSTIP